MQADQKVLAKNLITEEIRLIWEKGSLPETVEVSSFDDTFKIHFEKVKNKMTQVRILRVQAT